MPHFECGAFNHSATPPDFGAAPNGVHYLSNGPGTNKGVALKGLALLRPRQAGLPHDCAPARDLGFHETLELVRRRRFRVIEGGRT